MRWMNMRACLIKAEQLSRHLRLILLSLSFFAHSATHGTHTFGQSPLRFQALLFRWLAVLPTVPFPQKAEREDAIFIPSPPAHYSERPYDNERQKPQKPTLLVLHYTATSLQVTLTTFTTTNPKQSPVAAHYTISEEGQVYQQVAEKYAARHTGISMWRGKGNATQQALYYLNQISIGIEHVNYGYRERQDQPPGIVIPGDEREWYTFSQQQIEASIKLCRAIISTYKITPINIVGHSDISPGRKSDPGPLFPWDAFAKAGIGAWPDMTQAHPSLPCRLKSEKEGLLTEWLIDHLHLWGYMKPTATTSANDIIRAFQMHFRPSTLSGQADNETAHILTALLRTYSIVTDNECPCNNY